MGIPPFVVSLSNHEYALRHAQGERAFSEFNVVEITKEE
jgi:hypothetical protein